MKSEEEKPPSTAFKKLKNLISFKPKSLNEVSEVLQHALKMNIIDNALSTVNDRRARLGAFQNRLESTLNAASNYSQNLSSASSRISDVDYASESANMTKFQILQQAGVAALGQAKAIPQSILSLLG